MAVVAFLSDFGTADGFAAAMKGVVSELAPDARLVDATHDVPAGDVEAGAWALAQYWNLFPPGTVHLAVVDPGVGSARKAIAMAADERYVVAPDNGLITRVVLAASSWRCVELAEPAYQRADPSPTFHGRDIFAPAAAHLARGIPLAELGPSLDRPQLLDIAPPVREDRAIQGRIAHVDRFGNLITDIPAGWVDERWRFELAGRDLGCLRRTYADVGKVEPVVVVGSMGTVEVATRDASAAKELGAARGDPVVARI